MPGLKIDKATVERMLLSYIRDPNPTYVARECGVSWATAKKYITEGDPVLGIRPFALEARQILRAQDKLVRLTEVTKQVRVQIEEKDLASYQDLLFQVEAMIHEGIATVRARLAREQLYYEKLDAQAGAKEESKETPPKIPRPRFLNMAELKNVAVALSYLMGLKREFWDRLEVVRRTELTVGRDEAEGLVDAHAEPLSAPNFDAWTPQEISDYIHSVQEGKHPVYPPDHQPSPDTKEKPIKSSDYTSSEGKSAKENPKSQDSGESLPTYSDIEFPASAAAKTTTEDEE